MITYFGKTGKLFPAHSLAVPSDLLRSETLEKGLRSEQFKSSYETYNNVVEDLGQLPLDDDEKELARRILGTLYLWGLLNADPGRFMPIEELAEATLAELEGLHPKDAVLDLITRLKSDVPQIRYDKEKGARFEAGEGATDDQPHRAFGTFKKKAKTSVSDQDTAWRESLFWDFKTLEGVGDGGLFDGYGSRGRSPVLCIPDDECSIARHETQGTEVLPELSAPAGEVGRPRGAFEGAREHRCSSQGATRRGEEGFLDLVQAAVLRHRQAAEVGTAGGPAAAPHRRATRSPKARTRRLPA